MSTQRAKSEFMARRGELMVELFLQELGPEFVSRPTTADVGYDLLVGFLNKKKGINTFAVAIRAVERPLSARTRASLSRATADRLTHSNIPALLFVADVKQNKLFYAWLRPAEKTPAKAEVTVEVHELDDSARTGLEAQLRAADLAVPVAG
jgi:hypothetical protein